MITLMYSSRWSKPIKKIGLVKRSRTKSMVGHRAAMSPESSRGTVTSLRHGTIGADSRDNLFEGVEVCCGEANLDSPTRLIGLASVSSTFPSRLPLSAAIDLFSLRYSTPARYQTWMALRAA